MAPLSGLAGYSSTLETASSAFAKMLQWTPDLGSDPNRRRTDSYQRRMKTRRDAVNAPQASETDDDTWAKFRDKLETGSDQITKDERSEKVDNSKTDDKPSEKAENAKADNKPSEKVENTKADDKPSEKVENTKADDKPSEKADNSKADDKPSEKVDNTKATDKPSEKEENTKATDKPKSSPPPKPSSRSKEPPAEPSVSSDAEPASSVTKRTSSREPSKPTKEPKSSGSISSKDPPPSSSPSSTKASITTTIPSLSSTILTQASSTATISSTSTKDPATSALPISSLTQQGDINSSPTTSITPGNTPDPAAGSVNSPYSNDKPETGSTNVSPLRAQSGANSSTGKALIAFGTIGAIITILFVLWLAWKFLAKKQRRSFRMWKLELAVTQTLNRLKDLLSRLASRLPLLRNWFPQRSWAKVDKAYVGHFDEKLFSISTEAVDNSTFSSAFSMEMKQAEVGESFHKAHASRRPVPPKKPPGYRARKGKRISDVSSLSSGFGDGDIIVPAAAAAAAAAAAIADPAPAANGTHLAVPEPAARRSVVSTTSRRRETMYTEASEDATPRFRTVNSWVRQQTGRVKRAKQRQLASKDVPSVPDLPPEQDFRMMLPDRQEPRRVETTADLYANALRD